MIKFMVSLPEKLFNKLPKNADEQNEFIVKAIKFWLRQTSHLTEISKITSDKKAAASRENGKKGGRPPERN